MPKKNLIGTSKGKTKRTIRESGILRENTVNRSRPRIETTLK